MADFRGPWCIEGLSESTKFLMSEAWAPGTKACYNSCWSIWTRWCLERDMDPISTDLTNVLNFLSSCFQQGKAYRTINCYRSSISTGHIQVDNLPIGQHPWVHKLMKGIRLNRPPTCRYSTLWDVNLVLNFLESWPENQLLSLKQLPAKLTILLCLIYFKRVSDVRALDIRFRSFVPEGVRFRLFSRTKTLSRENVYPAFPQKPKLCVVQCLKAYELATSNLRSPNSHQLLLSFIKPNLPVSSTTLARWVRWIMQLAGIDTSLFGAHSSRGAMASKSLMTGGRLEDILKAADWSRESTFKSFYFKPILHVSGNVIAQL
ncbi:integrase/recombinase xerD homolog [Rhinophrynus dorsalis]